MAGAPDDGLEGSLTAWARTLCAMANAMLPAGINFTIVLDSPTEGIGLGNIEPERLKSIADRVAMMATMKPPKPPTPPNPTDKH